MLVKLLRTSKSFCKCWLQLLILTVLEIKAQKIPNVNLFKVVSQKRFS